MKKIKVISCMITIGIMALIFFFSSQDSTESSKISNGLIMWFLNSVPVFSPFDAAGKLKMAESIHFYVRKAAHFTIYAALGMSASSSIRLLTGIGYKRVFICSTIFCMLYAVSDEVHQWFVSGRSGRLMDVGIDTAGAMTGFCIFLCVKQLLRNIFEKEVSRE